MIPPFHQVSNFIQEHVKNNNKPAKWVLIELSKTRILTPSLWKARKQIKICTVTD